MKYIQPIASRRIRNFSLVILVFSFSILTTACTSQQFFTALFEKSAPVVRGWGEACIANNLTKADEYLLLDGGGDSRPSVCTKLANHPSRDKLSILSVEDYGSLIGSNTLGMRVKNKATGKSVLLNTHLVNTEQGVRIGSVDEPYNWEIILR